MWDKIKAWFHRSETIFWARLQMVIGAVIAAFASFNFSILMGGATKKDYIFGAAIFLQGVITELARRRNTEIDPTTQQLLPKP